MNTSGPVQYLQADELRGILDDAIRFWELRRVPYNLILAAVVIVWLVANRAHFHEALLWPAILALFVMAALANVLYSVAYASTFSSSILRSGICGVGGAGCCGSRGRSWLLRWQMSGSSTRSTRVAFPGSGHINFGAANPASGAEALSPLRLGRHG